MQIQENGASGAAALAYQEIMSALEAVPWDRAPEVLRIKPLGRTHIEFFPGHCGYDGLEFPIYNGIMVVANNFSSVKGWRDYCEDVDRESVVRTWRNLRVIIQASEIEIERFWFTNFCLGAMHRKTESYDFPKRIIKSHEFDQFFGKCVTAMKPALIVSLGRLAARHLGTDYAQRKIVDSRAIANHPTKLLAAVHPSAWTWQKRGFSSEDFRVEGERICAALRD